jgi:hypothetical protein
MEWRTVGHIPLAFSFNHISFIPNQSCKHLETKNHENIRTRNPEILKANAAEWNGGLLGIYLLLFHLRRCAFAFNISGFLVLIFSWFFVSKFHSASFHSYPVSILLMLRD